MSDLHSEEAIFAVARELPRHERETYLARACCGDVPLQLAVEALLRADEAAGTFLGQSPGGVLRSATRIGTLLEKPGDRIARYKLLEQIGEGGCGVVYVAEQEEPVRRRVALKVIKVGMDSKGVVARFEAERQALAMMDHPNIAKVLDAGATETGRPFFVMELVRGVKITDFCDQNELPLPERLELFVQVCRAVQHAHQKGIIHRDLKPSNILVTFHDGVPVPKVIDFGIAKATQGRLTDQTVYTAFAHFIGTPAYMSPEQAGMSSLDVDTRSDIYSLGVLLYELLTGQTPFEAGQLLKSGFDEMRRTIRESEPMRPSTKLSTMIGGELSTTASKRHTEAPKLIHIVRGDLDWIVMKCLEKDRSRRYETANGMAMDIHRYLNNEPILARPPSRLYQLQKLARRNQRALFAVSAVVAAVALALVVLAASNVRISKQKRQIDQALKDRGAALEAARTSEREAKEQLFLSLRNQARARRYSGQMGQRFESLAALKEAALIRPEEGLRDEVIASLALPDVRRGPKWHALTPNSKGAAFDSLYERYVRVDEPGIVTIRSVSDDRELQRLNSEQRPIPCSAGCALLFSPDGNYLAIRDSELHLHVWRLSDGALILGNQSLECWAMAFSHKTRRLAIGQAALILCFDLGTGQEVGRWPTPAQPHTLAFDPTDEKLAIGYSSSAVVTILSVSNGSVISELPVGAAVEEVVAWHPDGVHLAAAGSDPRIQLWDVPAERKVGTLDGSVQQITLLSFHPEGELLVSGGWEGVVRLWEPNSGRQVIKLPFGAQTGFHKGGRWLGVAWEEGETAELLEADPSHEYHTFTAWQHTSENILYKGDVSADGRLFAMGMDDGVHLWDLVARSEVASLRIGTTLSVHFQKHGRELVTCGPTEGLQCWPIQIQGENQSLVRLGPARHIPLPCTPARAAQTEDGTLAVVASEEAGECRLLNLESGSSLGPSLPHEGVCFVALSRNGRWMASAGWHSNAVRLWDVETSKLTQEWNLRAPLDVQFTPSGDELVICRDGQFDFVNLKTLAINRTIRRELGVYPGHVAFSPDGTMMSMEMSPGLIHLKELSSGRTVAKLEDPFGDRTTWMSFAPDGTQLVAAARYAGALHTWDLRSLRSRLKMLGLDWKWPEFPPVTAGSPSPYSSLLKVQIVSSSH